jgi:hypothetical protein
MIVKSRRAPVDRPLSENSRDYGERLVHGQFDGQLRPLLTLAEAD